MWFDTRVNHCAGDGEVLSQMIVRRQTEAVMSHHGFSVVLHFMP